MKKMFLIIGAVATFTLAACGADTSGQGGAQTSSTSTSSTIATSSSSDVGAGDSDGVGCDLYGPTEFEMGIGGESYMLQVPVECNPFYLEKGRPTAPDDINPHPDAYKFTSPQTVDACAE